MPTRREVRLGALSCGRKRAPGRATFERASRVSISVLFCLIFTARAPDAISASWKKSRSVS